MSVRFIKLADYDQTNALGKMLKLLERFLQDRIAHSPTYTKLPEWRRQTIYPGISDDSDYTYVTHYGNYLAVSSIGNVPQWVSVVGSAMFVADHACVDSIWYNDSSMSRVVSCEEAAIRIAENLTQKTDRSN
jgi:hypothetical protein